MRSLTPILILFMFSCINDRERKEETSAYFEKEIASRIAAIQDLKLADSLKVDATEVDKEVDRLLLMSKDVENMQASINLSKRFFDELAENNQMTRADFTDITNQMTLEEVENVLRGNELNFFNHVLFKYKGSSGVYTAH